MTHLLIALLLTAEPAPAAVRAPPVFAPSSPTVEAPAVVNAEPAIRVPAARIDMPIAAPESSQRSPRPRPSPRKGRRCPSGIMFDVMRP